MSWRPDLTVAAIVERDGRYLLIEERVGNRMVFNQPAGHVERGESMITAVVRETLEETARHFIPEALVGIYAWDQPERQRSFLRLAFCGRASEQDSQRALDRGIVRTLWMTRDQLAARGPRLRSPMVLRCIDDYAAGKRFPLDLLNHLSAAPETHLHIKAEARSLGVLQSGAPSDPN